MNIQPNTYIKTSSEESEVIKLDFHALIHVPHMYVLYS